MGWDYRYIEKGSSRKQFLIEELGENLTVHAMAFHGNTAYLAVEDKRNPGEVFGLVALLHRQANMLGVKWVDEDMGPNESMAPRKVLDLLSPAKTEYAQNWRMRCLANSARQERRKALVAGTKVRFARPLLFKGYGEANTFTVTNPKRGLVRPEGIPMECRITKRTWATDSWEIIQAMNQE